MLGLFVGLVVIPLAMYGIGRLIFRGEFRGRNRVAVEFASWNLFVVALVAAFDLTLVIGLAFMAVGLGHILFREHLRV